MDEHKQSELYRRILGPDVSQGLMPLTDAALSRISDFLRVANAQYGQHHSRGRVVGEMLFALTRYSAWAVGCHCRTRQELEAERDWVVA